MHIVFGHDEFQSSSLAPSGEWVSGLPSCYITLTISCTPWDDILRTPWWIGALSLQLRSSSKEYDPCRLGDGPKSILMDYFWEMLRQELYYTIVLHLYYTFLSWGGAPRNLQGCYVLASEIMINLTAFHECTGQEIQNPCTPEKREPLKMDKPQ